MLPRMIIAAAVAALALCTPTAAALSASAAAAAAAAAPAAPLAALPAAKLLLLDPSTGARCLDGTPSGFYIQPALTPSGKSTWVIELEGGGECASEASCKGRLNSAQGSSKFFTPTRTLNTLNSADPTANPDLYDANHVFLPYCVGDLWSGTVTAAGPKTWGLYFGGHLTVVAVVDALKRDWGLTDDASTRVVLTGGSAGGIGTWINADYLQEALLPSAQVSIASLAGFYFTTVPYTGPNATHSLLADFSAAGLHYNAGLWSSFVDISCADGHRAVGADPALCLLANNSLPYINVPAFAFEALSDAVQLTAHFAVPNPPLLCNQPEQDFLKQWRAGMAAALAPLAALDDARHGVFAPACWTHVFWQGPQISSISAIQAYGNWLHQRTDPQQYKIIDTCTGNFCNPTCTNPCASKSSEKYEHTPLIAME